MGYITSGMIGHSFGRSVGKGYVTYKNGVTSDWLSSNLFEIEVAGVCHKANPSLKLFYDQKNERIRL